MEKSARQKRRKLRKSVERTLEHIQKNNSLIPSRPCSAVPSTSPVVSVDSVFSISQTLNCSPLTETGRLFSDAGSSSDYEARSHSVTNSDTDRIESNISYSESDSRSETCVTENTKLNDEIRKWALNENITHKALDSLLRILGRTLDGLPKTARTLLQTENCSKLAENIRLGTGEYTHLGLEGALNQLVSANLGGEKKLQSALTLRINIDGLPLYRNSLISVWPILVSILGGANTTPAVVGFYVGEGKPEDIELYLNGFVKDFEAVSTSGLCVNSKYYNIDKNRCIFVCDAPAKAFVKCIKGHSGYYGCDKCYTKGFYSMEFRKITFPDCDSGLRTDDSFVSRFQSEHHQIGFQNKKTPLEKLGIGMVSQFPHDYMHHVCLGVVRKLLYLWRRGPKKIRIGWSQIKAISLKLAELAPYIPSEFNRKPRSIEISDRWKATECRQFLLYTGPVILCEVLDKSVYEHFMLLSVSLSILLDEESYKSTSHIQYAAKLIEAFVSHFPKREYDIQCSQSDPLSRRRKKFWPVG
jgi:hypothetical protein